MRLGHTVRVSLGFVGLGCLGVAWLAVPSAGQGAAQPPDAPASLRTLVLNAGHRERMPIHGNGAQLRSIERVPGLPYLLWPENADLDVGMAGGQAAVGSWLAGLSKELGFAGFTLRPLPATSFRDVDVWSWGLSLQGLEVFDAQVRVQHRGGVFLGIQNLVPGRLTPPLDLPAELASQSGAVLYAERAQGSGYERRLVPALRTAVDTPFGLETTLRVGGRLVVRRIDARLAAPAPDSAAVAMFSEFQVPFGSFPDQLGLDSSGNVWFSQPNNNRLSVFVPSTGGWRFYPTSGGSAPDGMIVDGFDRIWTGMYFSGQLGLLDPTKGPDFVVYPAPYASSRPAIPLYSRSKRIFVTDHELNRLSQFDPVNKVWLGSEVMPTPACWVVAGAEDAPNHKIYFSEYNADQIGIKDWNAPVVDVPTPGGGVAFTALSGGKVYYSQWSVARLGVYDIASGQITEYNLPFASEIGGPIDDLPDGRIALGTRGVGYIMIFDPSTQAFTAHQIPSAGAQLKDGLVASADGSVWFTESGNGKLGHLVNP